MHEANVSATQSINPKLEAALEYARASFSVFPLKPRSKAPATTNGLKDATTDEQRIRNWWTFNPEYNIGLRTGDGLVVVDIDSPKMTPESEAFVNTLPEETMVVSTGRGLHFYFRGDGKNTAGRLPGIDTRGSGGYVVAAPSIHENGSVYEVIGEHREPLPIPDAVITLMSNPTPKPVQSDPEGGATTEDLLVPVGGRNQWLTAAAGKQQRSGTLTLAGLLELNETRLEEPLSDQEVELIFNSVSRYTPTDPVQVGPDAPKTEIVSGADLCVDARELLPRMFEYLQDKGRVLGQTTGIAGLDKLLGGGFRENELGFLSANAKAGKTTLINQLINNLRAFGEACAYASAEMDAATEILPCMISVRRGENAFLADITPARQEDYVKAVEELAPLKFMVGYGQTPIERLEAWIRYCATEHKIKYFFADHAHFLCPGSEDYKMLIPYVTHLKGVCRELGIFLLLVVQPSKLADGQQLDMQRLRGGAALSQVMSWLLVLERYRHDGQLVQNVSKLTLDAKRSPLAKLGSIYLEYSPSTQEVFEVDPVRAENAPPSRYGE